MRYMTISWYKWPSPARLERIDVGCTKWDKLKHYKTENKKVEKLNFIPDYALLKRVTLPGHRF
jgi:hypothetical protein